MSEFTDALRAVYADAHQEWLTTRAWNDPAHRCDPRTLGCPQCQCRHCLQRLRDNPDDPTGEPYCPWCRQREQRQWAEEEGRRLMTKAARSPWAPDATFGHNPPLVCAERWQTTVDAANHQCQCAGQCGKAHPSRSEGQCEERGYGLHAVPAEMLEGQPPHLVAVCDTCHRRLLKNGRHPVYERAEWDAPAPTSKLARLLERHQRLGLAEVTR